MSRRFEFTTAQYGKFGAGIRGVIDVAEQVEFFRSQPVDILESRRLCDELLFRIARSAKDSSGMVARFENGGWEDFLRVRETVQPWDTELAVLLQEKTETLMTDPEVLKLVGPPLWPVAAMPKVVEVIVADHERLFRNAPERYRDTAWEFICDVEEWAWGAIQSSMCGIDNDPYEVALRLAVEGVYTLGKSGDELVLFSFRSDQ